MKKARIEIQLSIEFIMLLSGIFLGLFGFCVPGDLPMITLVTWGILFIVAAPCIAIFKGLS